METEVHIKQKEFEQAAARKGLNMTTLAKRLKINRVYLSNIKNESQPKFRPGPKLRDKLLDVLEVKFDDIFRFADYDINHKRENKKKAAQAPAAENIGHEEAVSVRVGKDNEK